MSGYTLPQTPLPVFPLRGLDFPLQSQGSRINTAPWPIWLYHLHWCRIGQDTSDPKYWHWNGLIPKNLDTEVSGNQNTYQDLRNKEKYQSQTCGTSHHATLIPKLGNHCNLLLKPMDSARKCSQWDVALHYICFTASNATNHIRI